MDSPETSVVIRAFNEAKHLPGLFGGLARQRYRDFETIVVDSGSFDGGRKIAQEQATLVVDISNHDFTFGFSLNAGIRAARGRYIAIVSAHTEPCDDCWLTQLIDPLREESVAMVYGRQLGIPGSKFSEIEDFERLFGPHSRIQEHPDYFANNANSAIRRDLWKRHPFDETLPGLEDMGWSKYWMGQGYRIVYQPTAAIYHIHDESWRQVRNRYHREAVAAHWIGIKSRRHVVTEILNEITWMFEDMARAIGPNSNVAAGRSSVMNRLREIALFRANKAYGTATGLFDGAAMASERARESMFYDRSGKAVQIEGPHKASLKEVSVPDIKPGDALIRVQHVAVCATDRELFKGSLGYYKSGLAEYPITPGHEFSGVVAALGSKANGLQVGDPVVVECIQGCGRCDDCRHDNSINCESRKEVGVIGANGAYAEYVVAGARYLHKVPAGVDMRKAALCEPVAVVLKGLRRLQAVRQPFPKNDESCAVVGAGPLGHICAKVLQRLGYRITTFDRSIGRLEFLEGSGVATSDNISEIGNFRTVVEVTGSADALEQVIRLTPAGATILLLGLPYGDRNFSFERIAAYDKTIIGSVGSGRQDFLEATNLIRELDLGDFTKVRLPLEKFKEAWDLSAQQDVLKVMIDVA